MEIQNTQLAQINELIDIINGFYDDEHISEGGTIYHMWDKPNIDRVRLLLEDLLLNKGKNLGISDQKFLMDIFSSDLKFHIREHLNIISNINNTDKIESFVIDVFDKVHFRLRSQYEKNNILFTLKQALTTNTNQSLSPKVIQKALEKKFAGKMILSFSKWETLYAIIKSNDNNHYLVDLNNNKIIQTCWENLDKAYKFDENKIFIFDQRVLKSKEQIQMFIEQFLITSNDGTVKSFFLFLKDQLNADYQWYLMKQIETLDDEIELADVYEQKWEMFSLLIQQLLNYGNVIAGNKIVFALNNQWDFECLGTYKATEKPNLLKENYKNLPGIQLPVTGQDNKRYVIVINGIQHDTFGMDE